MAFDAKYADFLEDEFLPPTDLTEDDRGQWHCELSVIPNSRFSLLVSSESGLGVQFHKVTHDYDDIIDCSDCKSFQYCKPEKYINDHPWCKHCTRAFLVLSLRKLRRQKEPIKAPVDTPQEPTLEDKMERAPLTNQKPFSIF